jgi:hypothetical protein
MTSTADRGEKQRQLRGWYSIVVSPDGGAFSAWITTVVTKATLFVSLGILAR